MSDLIVSKWLNTKDEISLDNLRGSVILVYVFQMLCPACVIASIPQANKIQQMFAQEKLQVLGLHSVFEHHDAMKEQSLIAFIHEFKVKFPVAIDKASVSRGIPQTMEKYSMQGTPTLLIYDKVGDLKLRRFGHVDDIELGFILGSLLS
ncbi:TlpA family protein disulfide reductase [Colwellia sp. MSW7]|uniref:TlpA family protein disulfide reductase n=1 Tax=Colwellia maritima TaxID=2912588 RepID=A0ABS9WWK8_9GAMM|nr:TlpA disulfide reductase family protein [Colwellia maritima]MCI2282344.1 TlpA family protein disulfide reductase [Colwellia maritima]